MKVPICPDFVVTSPGIVSLTAANYYTVRFAPASSTFLEVLGLNSRGDVPAGTLNREWTLVEIMLSSKDLIYIWSEEHTFE